MKKKALAKKSMLRKKNELPENAHRNARVRKAWKEKRQEIIKEGKCSECGKGKTECTLQIHHTQKEAYYPENFHLYEILSDELEYKILCKKCHFAIGKGKNLCPECRENYKQITYPTCFKCSGKEPTVITKLIYETLCKTDEEIEKEHIEAFGVH